MQGWFLVVDFGAVAPFPIFRLLWSPRFQPVLKLCRSEFGCEGVSKSLITSLSRYTMSRDGQHSRMKNIVKCKVVLICTRPSSFVCLLARPRLPPSAARCAYTSTTNERRERKVSCLLASHDGNGGGEDKNAETSSAPTRNVRLFLPLPFPHCTNMRRPLPPAVAVAPFAQSLPTKTYSTIPRRRVSTAACPCLVQMPVRMGSLPSGPDAPKKVKNGKSHTTKRIHKIHTGTRSVGKHVAAPRKKKR